MMAMSSRDGSSGVAPQSERSDLVQLAGRAMQIAQRRNLSIITAESCTAGKLAALLSEAEGAGLFLHGGFVTYTKDNKMRSLGVPAGLLARKSAVCAEVAIAMAEGALARSPASIAVAITGVAGPEPDEDGNPVGLVCISVVRNGSPPLHLEKRYGAVGRACIQQQAMADALAALSGVMDAPTEAGMEAAARPPFQEPRV
jgi:nicotinamide-nucleotide amidase